MLVDMHDLHIDQLTHTCITHTTYIFLHRIPSICMTCMLTNQHYCQVLRLLELRQRLDCAFARLAFVFPSFFLAVIFDFSTTPVGPVYCLWAPQTLLFSNFFIKNESHGTIYTFKNYFATVFSIFSFQQNKLYPNGS